MSTQILYRVDNDEQDYGGPGPTFRNRADAEDYLAQVTGDHSIHEILVHEGPLCYLCYKGYGCYAHMKK